MDHRASESAARNAHGGYGSFTLATTRFAAGSRCTILFSFGMPTHTAPYAAIKLKCSEQQATFGPTRIVATTRFVSGSMRETLGPPAFTTQTAPGETAMATGCGPTWIVARTLFVAGSMRETVSSEG